jgi:flavin reductase (DIM6/NTAB) family NADH-FMN oxidoreductase RutF
MNRLDAESFRAALSRFASGVTVVTARGADGRDHGMTVSAFSALSLDPPLVLVCLDAAATLLPHAQVATMFGVSVLAAGQENISARFANQDVERFEGVAFIRGAEGPALIEGAAAHLVCRRIAEHAGGDHVIIVGEVVRAEAFKVDPLIYYHRRYTRLAPDAGS